MCLTALTALVFFTSSVPRAETTVGERIPFDAGVLLPATPALKLAGGAEIGVSAKECGACHAENYSEWRDSTHAHAMKDPQYFAELSKPGAPRWLCLNCHAPNQNQR
ncbi:MAG: multiheme c-type cytochrome, partial [Myxococcota bacterium]